MNPQHLILDYSYFDNLYDNKVKRRRSTWPELVAELTRPHPIYNGIKERLPAFSGWNYKLPSDPSTSAGDDDYGRPLKWFSTHHTRRIAPNAVSVAMIILDCDGESPLMRARDRFCELEHVGYTSFNHGAEGKDKYRIVLPLASPISIAAFRSVQTSIQQWVENDRVTFADPASYHVCQVFLLPAVRSVDQHRSLSWHHTGQLLDASQFAARPTLPSNVSTAGAINRIVSADDGDRVLLPDMWLETAVAAVRVADIDRKISNVRCPFHADVKPTEFVSITANGLPYLHCKRCGTIYMLRTRRAGAVDPLIAGIAAIRAKKALAGKED